MMNDLTQERSTAPFFRVSYQTQTDAVDATLRFELPAYKTLNPDPAPIIRLLDAAPETIIVGRRYYDAGFQNERIRKEGKDGGIQTARESAELFAQIAQTVRDHEGRFYLEGFNECGLNFGGVDDAEPYGRHMVGYIEGLAELGIVPVIGSFPTGNPTYGPGQEQHLAQYWANYFDAVRLLDDSSLIEPGVLALRSYWARRLHDRTADLDLIAWQRQALESLGVSPRIWLTEFGVDLQLVGISISQGAGYKNGVGSQAYADDLRASRCYPALASVEHAFLFGVGMTSPWETFDAAGDDVVLEACS